MINTEIPRAKNAHARYCNNAYDVDSSANNLNSSERSSSTKKNKPIANNMIPDDQNIALNTSNSNLPHRAPQLSCGRAIVQLTLSNVALSLTLSLFFSSQWTPLLLHLLIIETLFFTLKYFFLSLHLHTMGVGCNDALFPLLIRRKVHLVPRRQVDEHFHLKSSEFFTCFTFLHVVKCSIIHMT